MKLYEHKLKELNPQVKQITYDIADLNNYLDTLQDVCALMYVFEYVSTSIFYLTMYCFLFP